MFNHHLFKATVIGAIATAIGMSMPKAVQAADFTPSHPNLTDSGELLLAQTAVSADMRILSVAGNGVGRVAADQAAIVFSYSLNYYPDMSASMPDAPGAMPPPPPIAQASDLKAVTDALTGAGIAASDISIVRESYSAQSLRMTVKVNNPTRERISSLVELAQNTAAKDSKYMASTNGVIYAARNCQAAEATARQEAMNSARAQAEALAATAGVSIGDIVRITGSPSWNYIGPYSNSTCPNNLNDSLQAMSSYGAMPYDPSLPAEVTTTMTISLDYEIK
jgi:hypothetical protein